MVLPADSPELVRDLADKLAHGGIAIVPCDTVYGIIGIVPDAEDRIRAAKGRGEDKPFLQLVSDITWVTRITGFQVPERLARHWPGPLTVIVPGRPSGTVAFRVPDSAFLRELVVRLGKPIYSTSVNRSGEAPLWRIREIRDSFESKVDLIVDGGDLPAGVPSTIVDATGHPARIVRQGALRLSAEELA